MIREIISSIVESNLASVEIVGDYEDKLDFLDEKGYETLDQRALKELGIKSTYDSRTGKTLFQVRPSDIKKLKASLPKTLVVVQKDAPVDFAKIKNKKRF